MSSQQNTRIYAPLGRPLAGLRRNQEISKRRIPRGTAHTSAGKRHLIHLLGLSVRVLVRHGFELSDLLRLLEDRYSRNAAQREASSSGLRTKAGSSNHIIATTRD